MGEYAIVFLAALILSLCLTPLVRRVALRLGAIDRPVARSMHTQPVPFLGGLAIFLAFAAALLPTVGPFVPAVRGILAGAVAIVLLGIFDDYRPLSPRTKLLGQGAAALILVGFGVRIDYVTHPAGGILPLGVWSVPLTVLWVVAVVNVVNLIDGLDGLAAGISSIAALTLLVSAIQTGQSPLAVALSAALAGSALGFLPYNFNPAKIFMGDAGSMFLGFTLAAVSVEGSLKSPAAIALAVPLLALGLPIADTFFAILRRWRSGRPIGQPDREHLHHRLLALGLTQREAVLAMYVASAWFGVSALAITEVSGALASLILLLVGLTLYAVARLLGLVPERAGDKSLKS